MVQVSIFVVGVLRLYQFGVRVWVSEDAGFVQELNWYVKYTSRDGVIL